MSMSGMPSYNPGAEEPFSGAKPVVPQTVQRGVWLILAAALMHVVSSIFGIINAASPATKAKIEEQLQGKSNLPANAADVAQSSAVVVGTVIAVITLALYIVIALLIRRGMNWARITGLVFAVLSLSSLVGMTFPAGIFIILQVLLGIAGIILCYMGASSAFFADSKSFRKAAKNRL